MAPHFLACPGRRTRVCVALLPILAAGCTLTPPPMRAAPPVPEQYADSDATTASIARIGWQDFFRDPELRRLITTAIEQNRDLRSATARVAEARAAWRIEGAPLYPGLDAAAGGTRGRARLDLPKLGTLDYDVKQVTAQLSTQWEIDFWGRLRALNAAARDTYLATEEARRAVATDLVAQVANGYLLEREYGERVALAARTIETREQSLHILQRQYEVGSGSRLEVTQAETLLGQARVAMEALAQDRAVNRNALSLLVGQPVTIAEGPLALAATAAPVDLPVGLPSSLLVDRPDIVAAEYRLRAAEANIGAARAAFLPNIALTGAFGWASTDLEGLFDHGTQVWTFAPQIRLPLFNAGRLKANLDVARARQVGAVAAYEKAIQGAFRDVSDALVRRRQLARQITATEAVQASLRERARLAQLRFDNGRSAYLEVLDAQRALFDTEQSLVQLRRAHLASGVALYAALGGGFAPTPFAQQNSQSQREAR